MVWTTVTGSEFAIAMPEGYETIVDPDYRMGTIDVSKYVAVMRHLNRVLLMVEMYEGNAKDIQKNLVSHLKRGEKPYRLTKDEIVNGVSKKQFTLKTNTYSRVQEFYLFKKRLYVIQTIAPDEKNSISETFLNSVQLGSNASLKKPSETFIEIAPTRIEEPTTEKPDREIVVFYKPRIIYSSEARDQRITGEVILNVLFSASGKVSKTEIISGPKELRQSALDSATKIRFLPAEKDEKLVSVWKEISYSFRMY